VYLGASPRGSLALYRTGQALAALAGRDYVIPDDIKALAEAALAHRLIIKTSSSMHDIDPRQVVAELLNTVPVDESRVAGAGRRGASADLPARAAAAKGGATGSPAR
jgi:MoxR-like ATPase